MSGLMKRGTSISRQIYRRPVTTANAKTPARITEPPRHRTPTYNGVWGRRDTLKQTNRQRDIEGQAGDKTVRKAGKQKCRKADGTIGKHSEREEGKHADSVMDMKAERRAQTARKEDKRTGRQTQTVSRQTERQEGKRTDRNAFHMS